MRWSFLLALALLLPGCFGGSPDDEALDEGSRVPDDVTPGEGDAGRVVSIEWVFVNERDEGVHFASTLLLDGEVAARAGEDQCPPATTQVAPDESERVRCQYALPEDGEESPQAEASASWRRSTGGPDEDAERLEFQLRPHEHAVVTATLAADGDLRLRVDQSFAEPSQ